MKVKLLLTGFLCLLAVSVSNRCACEPRHPHLLIGDANLSGSVEVGDAITALRLALDLLPVTPQTLRVSDLSPQPGTNGTDLGDGKVDVQDVLAILRLAVGIDSLDRYAYEALLPPDTVLKGRSLTEWGVDFTLWTYALGPEPDGVTFLPVQKASQSGYADAVHEITAAAGEPLLLSASGGMHPNAQMIIDYTESSNLTLFIDGRPVRDLSRFRSGPTLVDLGPDGAVYSYQILMGLELPRGEHEVWRYSNHSEWGVVEVVYNITVE